MKKSRFTVTGMSCAACSAHVRKAVSGIKGVSSVKVDLAANTLGVAYDETKVDFQKLKTAVEAAGYGLSDDTPARQPFSKVVPVAIVILALYFLLHYTVGFDFIGYIPRIDSSVSLAALFVTGLLTSVHCIAMCGGINLSQSVGAQKRTGVMRNPLLYNFGRVVSYTVVGAIAGGLGSVLFLSETVKAVILGIAALGMLFMGLSMLGWLPWWLAPRLPAFLSARAGKASAGKGPFVVGLLNGLIPCGPLQAMQLYALSTGSALTGALSMLLFSLGTVPLMLGAGAVFSSLKGKYTHVVQRVSAVLVLFFAVVMAAGSASLFGVRPAGIPDPSAAATSAPAEDADTRSLLQQALDLGYLPAQIENGVQTVSAPLETSQYPFIIVQKGIPVEFTITAEESAITGCNQTVVFPLYDVRMPLQAGDNRITFMPEETGLVPYTCWMGMLDGRILVVDSLDTTAG